MASIRVRLPLTVAAVAVLLAVTLSSSGVLIHSVSTVIDDSAQLAAGLSAAVACLWTARYRRGVERRWRGLVGIGMAGWSVGQAIWSWYQIFADTPLPSPSPADVGYFTLPVFAFAALLALAKDRTPGGTRDPGPRSRPVLVLDGLVVVGALFVVTWCTALGAVVRTDASDLFAFLVAIGYPLTDWILVVMVVLLLATYRVVYRRRTQLVLLGLGLVGISVSDSIFAYLVAVGAAEMPPVLNTGFVAGPALIAVAALADTEDGDTRTPAHARRVGAWIHLLAPYPPVLAAGLVVLLQTARGHGPGRLRSCVGDDGTVARLGGDEFGVLLPGDVELVRDLGTRILMALRRPFDVNGRAITIGASLGGVISGPTDRLTAETLLRRADAAMYTGKRRGKGGLVVYEPGTAAALG